MTQQFVVINQHGHYFGKQKAWTDGRDPARVYCPKHQDEALNTLLEINAKDIDLRGEVMAVDLNERGLPILDVSDIPLPEPASQPDIQPEQEMASQGEEKAALEPEQGEDQPA